MHCATHQEEVESVLKKIHALKAEDSKLLWSDIAILVRSNNLANPFISACVQAHIPYQFFGLKGLYAKPAIVDALAYFKVVENFHDGPALYRVLSFPVFGIGTYALVQLGSIARKKGHSLWQAACKSSDDADISDDDKKKIQHVVSRIERHADMARTRPIAEVFFAFLKDTGYLADVSSADTERTRDALNYLNQLFQKAKDFQGENPWARLRDFMELVALEQEAGDAGVLTVDIETGPDAVRMMTIHGAKGLEFRYVFVVNMIDRRFPVMDRDDEIDIPNELSREAVQANNAHLEEERRLLYVALTRAKDEVFLTSARDYGGARKRKLSQFLHELGYTQHDVSHNVQPRQEVKKTIELEETLVCIKPKKSQGSMDTQVRLPLPSHVSFTQLAAFQTCPLQYKFSFILHIPVLGKRQFSFGKTIHATLEEFFNSLSLFNAEKTRYTAHTASLPPFEKFISIYQRQWIDEWYGSQKEKDEYFAKGKEMLAHVYAELMSAPFQTTDIEKDFTIKVGGYPHYIAIRGRIDRIDTLQDGTVEIIDYKTGEAKNEKKIRAEDKEQLTIYHIACQEVLGKKPARLTYWYLKDNVKVSFLPTEKEVQKWKEKISQIAQEMHTSDFKPTPGFHCTFCDYRDICEFRQI
jgi:DNA helicase-2/ATP-dependent DNA helicase PcrA